MTKKSKVKKLYILSIILTILIVIIIYNSIRIFSLYETGGVGNKNSTLSQEINLTIDKGSTLKDIANVLKENNVIQSSFFFVLKAKEFTQSFQYGNFTFTPNMDFNQIIQELQTPNKNQDYVTLLVKEGDTRLDIANSLQDLGLMSSDEFLKACDTLDFEFDFLKDIPTRENTLEGYLYPDTYYIGLDETPEDIILKLLNRFDEVFTQELRLKANEINLSIDEVIIIASIIEKEIKISSEKEIAASVIFNRLNANMKLQMDSTVIYALGDYTDRVLYSDTEIKSEYNTYYVDGLPIGPICNPSIDTIKAVLYPADTDYLYYVVKDIDTGEHFFTSSYSEFLDYKSKYLTNFE